MMSTRLPNPDPSKPRASSTRDLPDRFSINPSDAQLLASLKRRAKASGQSVSRIAEQAIQRGLGRSVQGELDPIETMAVTMRDFRRVTERDLAFMLELIAELGFDLFQRLPRSPFETDPAMRQAAAADLDMLLDRVAARHVQGRKATLKEAANSDAPPKAKPGSKLAGQ
ncbi:MAG: hypothetical protein HC777_04010 [Hyphomonadaceae bacterium]|nr:hypothetical protein [Hyphomonadaceae bacterium]